MRKILLAILLAAVIAFFVSWHMRYGVLSNKKHLVSVPLIHSAAAYENDFSEENEIDISANVMRDVTEFKVNAPVDFDYKTKAEIYEIRKKFVSQSLFKNPSYKPSESIFGQIADGKPWIPLKFLYYSRNAQNGISEESRFINNPSALVMLDVPFSPVNAGNYWGEDMYLLPKSISYYKKENTIKVAYSLKKFFDEMYPQLRNDFVCFLNGLNARDFGYPWIFAYESENVTFRPASVKENAGRIREFIHLGMSTGVPRNNGSPRQQELEFRIDGFPAYVKIKLWKKQPSASSDKADIMTELYFDN